MTDGLEGIAVAQWAYKRLTEDPALQVLAGSAAALRARVLDQPPPQDLKPWWIEFNVLPPRDVRGADATKIMAAVDLQAKVVGPTMSYGALLEPYRRVHAVLEHRSEVVVAEGVVMTSIRVSGVQYPERTNGIEYRHLGGLYETRTQ